MVFQIIQSIFSLIYSLLAAILHFLWTLIPRIGDREGELAKEFHQEFLEAFKVKLPSELTSLSMARKKALREGKPLIAYFHDHSQNDWFCQTVLSQSMLLELIEARFILWCDTMKLPIGYFPALLVWRQKNSGMELVKNMQNLNDGQSDLNFVYSQLIAVLEKPVEVAPSLRQEQDEAYQKSLEADLLKKQQQQQEVKKRVVMVDRDSLLACLPEPPANGINLSVLLPNNSRCQRRWSPSEHTLTQLYDWVYCEWSECTDRNGFLIRYPIANQASDLTERPKKTLAEVGLTVSTKLIVEIP